jgi:threonine/homoserine/homoserine lactone efflux protein
MMPHARHLARQAIVPVLVLAALVLVGYQLWLSSHVLECWASRENLDHLPRISRLIGVAALAQAAVALGLAVLAWLGSGTYRAWPRGSSGPAAQSQRTGL